MTGQRRIRVLVAEDSSTTRELLVAMLGADPEVQVVGEARNGVEAVNLTRDLRPEVVTMDVRMPEMDGFEATRKIREREAEAGSGRLPIVALTANALASELEKCRDAGMDGHLTKPCSIEELKAALQHWVSPQ